MLSQPLVHHDGGDDLDPSERVTGLGIDLGGTKLRGARCPDLRGHAERARDTGMPPDHELIEDIRRERVGEVRDPEAVVERVAGLVEALRESGVTGPAADSPGSGDPPFPVGVGVAGMPRDREGFIVEAPNLGWKDVPFGAMLRERLGSGYRLRVVNDVNAVTWGEFSLGAGVGTREMLAVYVGTGVGGGFVCNGRLVEGAGGSAGEIGHFRVVRGPDARRCGCGKRGCVEAYAGGRALGERIESELERGRLAEAARLAGSLDDVTVEHVDRAAAGGDPDANRLWEEAAELLGTGIANAVTLLNPERLVLGGGVLRRTPDLKERVVEVVRAVAVRAAVASLTIDTARLGDDAGIVGAALLAQEGR